MTAGLQLYTNSSLMGGESGASSMTPPSPSNARPTRFMLIARVDEVRDREATFVRCSTRRVAHRIAAAAHAKLAGDRGERQDRSCRAAAIAIAFDTPAALHQRR